MSGMTIEVIVGGGLVTDEIRLHLCEDMEFGEELEREDMVKGSDTCMAGTKKDGNYWLIVFHGLRYVDALDDLVDLLRRNGLPHVMRGYASSTDDGFLSLWTKALGNEVHNWDCNEHCQPVLTLPGFSGIRDTSGSARDVLDEIAEYLKGPILPPCVEKESDVRTEKECDGNYPNW